MQRGVLILTKEEVTELLKVLNIDLFINTQLHEKLKSASQSDEQEIKILISEDEIERILDEVGPPIYESNIVNQTIEKIDQLLITLRPKQII